jgi:hypothetical protein
MSKTADMTLDDIIRHYRMHHGDAVFLRELLEEVKTLREFAQAAVNFQSKSEAAPLGQA